ncbi:unnamed protein product, partial [Symbiodinium sp. CCMP2456]
ARTMADFDFTKLDLSNDAQAYIASFETLTRIALLHCASAMVPFGRLRVRIKSWSDNAGAESVSNKLYTWKCPLCTTPCFVQFLFIMSLDVSHIPSEYNKDADMLSRIQDFAELPSRFPLSTRLLDVEQLWFRRTAVFLNLPDFPLRWKIPVNDFFR